MSHEPVSARPVGPVLEACAVTDAVVDALRELNPQAIVLDRGSYVRILTPGRLVLTAQAVSVRLGREFVLPRDLERIMSSYRGRFSLEGGRAVWYAAGSMS